MMNFGDYPGDPEILSKIWSLLDYAGELAALHPVNSKGRLPNCSISFGLFPFRITVFVYSRSRLYETS